MTPAEIRQLAREIAAEQARIQSVTNSDLFICRDLAELKKSQHQKLMAEGRSRK